MPYEIRERDGKFCVFKENDDKPLGCHPTREAAERHLRALYASEPEAAKLSRFVPFIKVDDEKRIVYGVASDETPDVDGEIVDYEATKAAVADWANWRNIREMHRPSAVGVAEQIVLNDQARTFEIAAKIVDDAAWEKVKAGVYKGFSIGGRKLQTGIEKAGGRTLRRIKKYLLTEVSLVDRPANPSAVFTIVKREQGGTMKEKLMELIQKLRGNPEELDDALKQLEKTIESLPDEDQGQDEEAVRKAVDARLSELGLIPEEGEGEPFAKVSEVKAVSEAVQGLAKTEDMAKLAGDMEKLEKALDGLGERVETLLSDLAKSAAAVDDLQERVEKMEKNLAGTGPVLRELGALNVQSGQEAVLKSLFEQTDDPQLRQVLGQKIAELQIRAAQGNVMQLR